MVALLLAAWIVGHPATDTADDSAGPPSPTDEDADGDDYADVVIGNSWGGRDDHPGLLGLFFGGPRP